MIRVTADELRALGACDKEQVEIVEREWPNGVPVTVQSILKALRLGLDAEWYANMVLTTSDWVGYYRVRNQARDGYERARDQAWAEYCWGASSRRTDPAARAKYLRATFQAWADCRRAQAQALAPKLREAKRGQQ